MKRILVVDESRAVRETLSIILGRDFTVIQQPVLPADGLPALELEADLLIMGVPPGFGTQSSYLFKLTSQVLCPVLLLLDSRSTPVLWQNQDKVDCLAKPFNPYELREKVFRLLAGPDIPLRGHSQSPLGRDQAIRYVDFPYLPLSTSALIKRFALTSLPILILGEAGSGQERVARGLHCLKEMAGPWIAANPPGITRESLLERIGWLSRGEQESLQRITVFLSNLDTLDLSAQGSLLDFFEEEEGRGNRLWILSSSRADLLEKVYRGEFLDGLYYRLATLTLRLPPLRERRDDLPSLAARLAQEYGERLNLGKVSFSPEAIERLCNYLWFGNLDELGVVIARTLATHRKGLIEASNLVLDNTEEAPPAWSPVTEEKPVLGEESENKAASVSCSVEIKAPGFPGSGNGGSPDIGVLINELAHELKNPMVTIKTFAQLLGERFDDETFRVRFRETVSKDIERMDELLEAILDFSRFTQPAAEKVLLYEELRQIVEEIVPECIKREATVRWLRRGESGEVFADGSHLRYAFKNVLRTILAELIPRGEIQIDMEGGGRVALTYVREGGRMSPITHYLDPSSSQNEEAALPLRLVLAKILLGRNGAEIKVNHLDGGKVLIRAEIPEH